jgi:purine-binding chemotaxis protein CheW
MESTKYVVFQARKEEFGFPVASVISIEKMQDITDLPEVPVYMKGITNFRGSVVPVLDIVHILYKEQYSGNENNKIILLNINGSTVGVIVDEAKAVLDVLAEDIKEVNGLITQNQQYITGVVKSDTGFITLLNPTELIMNLQDIDIIKEHVEQI